MFETGFSEKTSAIYEHYTQNPLPPLGGYIEKFTKKGHSVGSSYLLASVNRTQAKLVPSTNFGLELRVEGKSLATLGYDFFETYRGIRHLHLVRQLKGIRPEKGQHYLLEPLKWERMMLKIFEDIVAAFNFELLGVEPAEQNEWYDARYWEGTGFYEDTVEDHRARMRMRYNVSARRNGFKFDPKTKLFLKVL